MSLYYERDGITIYHGDCLDVLPTLAGVDHVITDPPYSDASHAMHDAGKRWAQRQDGLVRAELRFDSIDGPYIESVLNAVAVARWAVFTMDERIASWLRVSQPRGFKYVRTGVWVKPGSMPQFTGDRPAMGYEPVVIMHAAGSRTRWNGGGRAGVWQFPPVHGEHPTQKPLALYRSFVELFTDPGEVILDPFMGSGTTLLAALNLGRRAIGIEREEKWCEAAAKRLEGPVSRNPEQLGLKLDEGHDYGHAR